MLAPNLLLKIALLLHKFLFSVIPVKFKSKIPVVPWIAYQTRLSTRVEICNWFGFAHLNIGVVVGKISNLVVIDADSQEAVEWVRKHLPDTPWKTLTRKGIHFFYRYPSKGKVGRKIKVRIDGKKLDLDILGDGSFVVMFGSIHEEGHFYKPVEKWLATAEVPVFNWIWFKGLDNENTTSTKGDDITSGKNDDFDAVYDVISLEKIDKSELGWNNINSDPGS